VGTYDGQMSRIFHPDQACLSSPAAETASGWIPIMFKLGRALCLLKCVRHRQSIDTPDGFGLLLPETFCAQTYD
jgi:hypothetical protein